MNKEQKKTDAQKRASAKWEAKFKQRIVRIPFDVDEKLVAHAKNNKESINGLLIRIIKDEIDK